MIVDFHCHTKNIKSGDGPGREVSIEVFANKIASSRVELIAITNHNSFDQVQFNALKESVKEHCKVWPGVELDIRSDKNERYHLIVICNPKNTLRFDEQIKKLIDKTPPNNYEGSIEDIVRNFDSLDCIFMPHFHKSPSISEEEYEKLSGLLSNPNRLIAEATNVTSMEIFVNHDINCIAGSDIKDWSKYPGIELPELRLDIEEYENLCDLLDRDSAIVKTLLDKNNPVSYDVYPAKGNYKIKEKIRLYKEVNVIFGDKGTGKSEVIRSLIKKLKTEDIPFASYISSETKESLDELLSTDDMNRSAESLGIDGCEGDFELIEDWGDRSLVPLSAYVEYYKTDFAKANQKRIGWSRMIDASDGISAKVEKIKADLENIGNSIDSLATVKITNYLEKEQAENLHELLQILLSSAQLQKQEADIEYQAFNLMNFTIEKFRYYTSIKTGNATRPPNTGFGKFATNRLKLKKALIHIKENLQPKVKTTYEILGQTGGKGRIDIETRYRMLRNDSKVKSSHKEYDRQITKLKPLHERLLNMHELALSYKLEGSLIELRDEIADVGVKSTGDFVGIYKQTVDKNHDPYEPSSGERSIIFIQRALEDSGAKIYLLDEPELSMANNYIDEVIRPKISALGRQKKIVVLATHNANIAVRTLPYTTIYRSHGASGYSTYVGNAFTNKLTNIIDDTDVLNWKEMSMRILEGGAEAFYDRKGIYESGRD